MMIFKSISSFYLILYILFTQFSKYGSVSEIIIFNFSEHSATVEVSIDNDQEYQLNVKSINSGKVLETHRLTPKIKYEIQLDNLKPGGKFNVTLSNSTGEVVAYKYFVTHPLEVQKFVNKHLAIDNGGETLALFLSWVKPEGHFDHYFVEIARCFKLFAPSKIYPMCPCSHPEEYNFTSNNKLFRLPNDYPDYEEIIEIRMYTESILSENNVPLAHARSKPLSCSLSTRLNPPTKIRIDNSTLSPYNFSIVWGFPEYKEEIKYNKYQLIYYNIDQMEENSIDICLDDYTLEYNLNHNIKPGHTYNISLSSFNSDENCESVNFVSNNVSITATTPPLEVENITITHLSSTEIKIDWAANEDSYQDEFLLILYEVSVNGKNNHKLTKSIQWDENSALIPGLASNQTYNLTVLALSKGVESAKQSIKFITLSETNWKSVLIIVLPIGTVLLIIFVIIFRLLKRRIKRRKKTLINDQTPLMEYNRNKDKLPIGPGRVLQDFDMNINYFINILEHKNLEYKTKIGWGSYGMVLKCRSTEDNKFYAIKIIISELINDSVKFNEIF